MSFRTKFLNEIAQIGYIKDKQNKSELYNVCVWTNDGGEFPHVHITNKENTKSKKICVRLDKPEYFKHGPYKDIFNSSELECFITFMKNIDENSIDDDFPQGQTHYRTAVKEWNRNNSQKRIDVNTPIPDYSKLNTL